MLVYRPPDNSNLFSLAFQHISTYLNIFQPISTYFTLFQPFLPLPSLPPLPSTSDFLCHILMCPTWRKVDLWQLLRSPSPLNPRPAQGKRIAKYFPWGTWGWRWRLVLTSNIHVGALEIPYKCKIHGNTWKSCMYLSDPLRSFFGQNSLPSSHITVENNQLFVLMLSEVRGDNR